MSERGPLGKAGAFSDRLKTDAGRLGALPWLDRWWIPFLWITLSPAVTVPVSVVLFTTLAYRTPEDFGLPPNDPNCGEFLAPDCHSFAEVSPTVAAFVLPGLLNVAPLLWTRSRDLKAKSAGFLAGLAGLIRLTIPAAVLLREGAGRDYYDWWNTPGAPAFGVFMFGLFAWLGSLAMLGAFVLFSKAPRLLALSSALIGIGALASLWLGLLWLAVVQAIRDDRELLTGVLLAVMALALAVALAGLRRWQEAPSSTRP